MKRLSKLIGIRIRFKFQGFKYEGTFLGIGKKKGTDILGLLFEDIYEAIGKKISSWALVHPDDIEPTNKPATILTKRAKEIFKEHHHTKNEDIYYPPHQMKIITVNQASKMLEKMST